MKVILGILAVGFFAFAAGYPSSRIIGGAPAGKAIPYVVSIQVDNTHVCGGFIYNNKWVITAASCVENRVLNTLKVSVNDYKFISNNDPHETKVNVFKVIVNEGYNSTTKDNDIALVELAQTLGLEPLSTNDPIANASCIRYDELSEYGVTGEVAGWGIIEPNGGNVTTLHIGQVQIVPSSECEAVADFTATTMICTTTTDGATPCLYDQGSPLVVTSDEETMEPIAVGIFSYNNQCNPNEPSVFTRISVFYAWIAKNAGPEPADCFALPPVVSP